MLVLSLIEIHFFYLIFDIDVQGNISENNREKFSAYVSHTLIFLVKRDLLYHQAISQFIY